MKKWTTLATLAAALMLLIGVARGEGGELRVSVEGIVRPGAATLVSVSVPEEGVYDLVMTDGDGQTLCVIAENRPAEAGVNLLYWNGTYQGVAAPEGEWQLVMTQGGNTARASVTVGPMAACLIGARLSREAIVTGEKTAISWFATQEGELTVLREGDADPFLRLHAAAGWGEAELPAAEKGGDYTLRMTLTAEDGTVSEPVYLSLKVEETIFDSWASRPKSTSFTPSLGSSWEGKDQTLNYWTLPMDITDTEAVWAVLTAPVTVVDNGKTNAERTQVVLRKEPRADSPGVGVVTCITQAVHVIERGDEWTLVECYSSSFHDSSVKNWNALVQGYLPTAYLKETVPDQTIGLVVDKLNQTLYIFQDGELFDTLLVSTGLANEKQPYNETRSGEFLLHSWVGAIPSDDVVGRLAMRFNDGDLIHEVPYSLMSDGKSRDYTATDRKLGSRASHGCIRVQRKQTPKGTNHEWLWNHRKRDMKILIWEDWQGRQLACPDDGMVLYISSGRNPVYHTSRKCSQVKGARLNQVLYGQLEDKEYQSARRCGACGAPLKRNEIEEINALYAEGGDHDPVMTAAREKARRVMEETEGP